MFADTLFDTPDSNLDKYHELVQNKLQSHVVEPRYSSRIRTQNSQVSLTILDNFQKAVRPKSRCKERPTFILAYDSPAKREAERPQPPVPQAKNTRSRQGKWADKQVSAISQKCNGAEASLKCPIRRKFESSERQKNVFREITSIDNPQPVSAYRTRRLSNCENEFNYTTERENQAWTPFQTDAINCSECVRGIEQINAISRSRLSTQRLVDCSDSALAGLDSKSTGFENEDQSQSCVSVHLTAGEPPNRDSKVVCLCSHVNYRYVLNGADSKATINGQDLFRENLLLDAYQRIQDLQDEKDFCEQEIRTLRDDLNKAKKVIVDQKRKIDRLSRSEALTLASITYSDRNSTRSPHRGYYNGRSVGANPIQIVHARLTRKQEHGCSGRKAPAPSNGIVPKVVAKEKSLIDPSWENRHKTYLQIHRLKQRQTETDQKRPKSRSLPFSVKLCTGTRSRSSSCPRACIRKHPKPVVEYLAIAVSSREGLLREIAHSVKKAKRILHVRFNSLLTSDFSLKEFHFLLTSHRRFVRWLHTYIGYSMALMRRFDKQYMKSTRFYLPATVDISGNEVKGIFIPVPARSSTETSQEFCGNSQFLSTICTQTCPNLQDLHLREVGIQALQTLSTDETVLAELSQSRNKMVEISDTSHGKDFTEDDNTSLVSLKQEPHMDSKVCPATAPVLSRRNIALQWLQSNVKCDGNTQNTFNADNDDVYRETTLGFSHAPILADEPQVDNCSSCLKQDQDNTVTARKSVLNVERGDTFDVAESPLELLLPKEIEESEPFFNHNGNKAVRDLDLERLIPQSQYPAPNTSSIYMTTENRPRSKRRGSSGVSSFIHVTKQNSGDKFVKGIPQPNYAPPDEETAKTYAMVNGQDAEDNNKICNLSMNVTAKKASSSQNNQGKVASWKKSDIPRPKTAGNTKSRLPVFMKSSKNKSDRESSRPSTSGSTKSNGEVFGVQKPITNCNQERCRNCKSGLMKAIGSMQKTQKASPKCRIPVRKS